jgi:hypothetical protein
MSQSQSAGSDIMAYPEFRLIYQDAVSMREAPLSSTPPLAPDN